MVCQSGKSVLVAKIIRHRYRLFTHALKTVLFVYTEWQLVYDEIQDNDVNVHFLNNPSEVEPFIDGDEKLLIIYGDQVQDLISSSKNKTALSYALQKSHHRGLVFIFLTQSLFLANCRLLQINVHYLIIFRLIRDNSSIYKIGYQILPKTLHLITTVMNLLF